MLKKLNINFVILVITILAIFIIIIKLKKNNKIEKKQDVAFYLAQPSLPPHNFSYKIIKTIDSSVLKRGSDDNWDNKDVLNPDIVKFKNKYINYYSGYNNGVWSTGYAESKDGYTWQKKNNPILTIDNCKWTSKYIAANGSSITHNDSVYLYFQGANDTTIAAIGLAISNDGYTFNSLTSPVLLPSINDGAWDSKAVADPFIFKHNNIFYLYYLGQSNVDMQKLGVAISNDGINWTKHINNPILDIGIKGSFDENGLGEPAIFYEAPYFYMIYTGRNASEQRNLGLAISSDGINWKKMNYNGIIDSTYTNKWNNQVICDPEPVLINNQRYIYYGGGNNPSPDQGLNGEIGFFILELPSIWQSSTFDSNFDWSKSELRTTDIFKGSHPIEGEENSKYIWIEKNASITLIQEETMNSFFINAYLPFDQIIKNNSNIKDISIKITIDGNIIFEKNMNESQNIELEIPFSTSTTNKRYIEIDISEDFKPEGDARYLALLLKSLGFKSGNSNKISESPISSFDCNNSNNHNFNGLYAIDGNKGERYAWSSKESKYNLYKKDENQFFVFEGYIPYEKFNLKNKKEVDFKIKIDNNIFYHKKYSTDQAIIINTPADIMNTGIHEIVISLNAEFIPENDNRKLSFVLKKVGFY